MERCSPKSRQAANDPITDFPHERYPNYDSTLAASASCMNDWIALMITILGRRNSSSVQLVMWAINEIGVEFERLDYGHGFATTNTPAYLAMNPMGRVPVLQDGPVTMFESAAILRYLGAAYGSETFWPACPRSRASLDAIAEWGKNTFAEGVLRIFVYEVRMPAATRDPAFLAAAVENLIPLAKIFEGFLRGREWVGGDHFTFADIACGHILHRYFSLDWDRPDLPMLRDYYEKLQQRTAYQQNAMVPFDDLKGSYRPL